MLAMLGKTPPGEVLAILRAVASVAAAVGGVLGELRQLLDAADAPAQRHGVAPELLAALAAERAPGDLDAAALDTAARNLAVLIQAHGLAEAVERFAPGRAAEVLARYLLLATSKVEPEGARNVCKMFGG